MAYKPVLLPGQIYRDLDGGLVQVVSVDRELCCWISLTQAWPARQVTHRDNFLQRFRPLADELSQAA